MSSKKNAREKKLARQAAEKKARDAAFRRKGISIGMALVGMAIVFLTLPAFGEETVGNSAGSLERFLEERNRQEVSIVKTAQEGRIRAVLYEEGRDGQLGVSVFERRLFGLRWAHERMERYGGDGMLYLVGSWQEGGTGDSRCYIVVCGDNRGGEVSAYTVADADPAVHAEVPDAYILDLYLLDGADALPQDLQVEKAG